MTTIHQTNRIIKWAHGGDASLSFRDACPPDCGVCRRIHRLGLDVSRHSVRGRDAAAAPDGGGSFCDRRGAAALVVDGEPEGKVANPDGLAYRIALLRRHMAMDVIVPYVLWVALLLFLVDQAMRYINRTLHPWFREA